MRGTQRFAYLLLESPLPHHSQITAGLPPPTPPRADEGDDVGGCERMMRIARWMRRERNPRERRDDELKWIGARHEALLFLKSRIVLNIVGW